MAETPEIPELVKAVWSDRDEDAQACTPLGRGDAAQSKWASFANAEQAAEAFEGLRSDLPTGVVYLHLHGVHGDRELATLRNRLWPHLHLGSIYQTSGGELQQRTLQGKRGVGPAQGTGQVLVAGGLGQVMSQDNTTQKFDQNAKKWDGSPGSPGYPHFRWMRRYVGLYARPSDPRRILDFGSGAGWVGIEAARSHPDAELCFFDPSPEMVRIAEENARAQGLKNLSGRVGFGEDPPFPAAGEERFDWVISSGVISFSPDPKTWIDGLLSTLAPGATLVIGDIEARAWGFRKRRKTHPLLPVRELNAKGHAEVRSALQERGLHFLKGSGYQCTFPVPQLMHLNETRMGGILTYPLLGLNRVVAGLSRLTGSQLGGMFDSWVMSFRVPGR